MGVSKAMRAKNKKKEENNVLLGLFCHIKMRILS